MKSFLMLLTLVLPLGLAASCVFVVEGKGSSGRCELETGSWVELCDDCGDIKGSELCCTGTGEECVECGKRYGSPGCCN